MHEEEEEEEKRQRREREAMIIEYAVPYACVQPSELPDSFMCGKGLNVCGAVIGCQSGLGLVMLDSVTLLTIISFLLLSVIYHLADRLNHDMFN